MCFGKKEKPQPSPIPREKHGSKEGSGPRRASDPPQPQAPSPPHAGEPPASSPPPASQPRTPTQPRASRSRVHSQPQVPGQPRAFSTPPAGPSPAPASSAHPTSSQPASSASPPPTSQPRASPPRATRPQGQNHKDILAAPPLGATGDSPQPPQEPSQQDGAAPQEVTPNREVIVAVMGVTGAGKSYFVREVSGNSEVKVSDGLYSCTDKVQSYSFEFAGATVTLVDTPGFNDMERSDIDILEEIATWTTATYKQGQLLSGIIYLHPITHTRMEGSAMGNLKMFRSLCGQEALKNVLLTTTQWSSVKPADGEHREDSLKEDGFWGGLISKGATLQRFTGDRESGLELIRKLIPKTPERLEIQDEIVERKMNLADTDAGRCLNEELIALVEKLKGELESVKRECRVAMEEKEREVNEKLEKAEHERKKLAELHEKEVNRLKEEEEKNLKEIRRLKKIGSEREVIAVDTKDIAVTAHFTNLFTTYTTRGRLIYDTNNHEEFESDSFEVTIRYDPKLHSGFQVHTKTLKELFDAGRGNANYVILGEIRYQCQPNVLTTKAGQSFVIFSRV